MEMEELILVSVDDHVNEPPDMFTRHIPAKFKGREPRVNQTEHGQAWVIEGQKVTGLGLNAVVGRPKTEYGHEPTSYEQMREGTYDIHARIADMNVNGVLGSINFASFPGFGGNRFIQQSDKDLALATIRAYNDWHLQDWCGPYPDRMIPLALLPLWDVDLTLAETNRMADLGVHAVAFSDNPALNGLKSIHDPAWEPFWSLCEERGVVICCHIGTGARAEYPSDDSPIGSWITAMPISIANSAADWLFADFWKRHPKLKMALSEGGIGWIPYFLERADYVQQQHGAWTRFDFGGEKPSDVFRRHFITCFIEDDFGLHNLDYIGVDNVSWECDYPHSDCMWPKSPESLWKGVKHLSKDVIDKITHLNVMRDFSYDPLKALGRENCTVGALRAQATDVDTSERSYLGGLNPSFDPNRPVTSRDIKKILATV
ncbi:MAG: amidohydrolase [Phenylobacterium sp.]|nr:amidohydrolase [Phenylobacterium sp.]